MLKTTPTVRYAMGTLIAALLLALGAAMLVGLFAVDRPLPPLAEAVSADATITGRHIQPGQWSNGKFPRKSDDRYFVHVTFAASETEVQANDIAVGRAYFDANLPGKHVTVWYFPDRPQINVLGEPDKLASKGSQFGQMFGWLLLGLGAVGTVIYGNKLHVARGGRSLL